MSQVTYTVGLLDARANLVYSGTLEVQLEVSNIGVTPQSGLLSIGGFPPVLLTAVSGSGQAWNLSGSNSALSVSTTALYPAVLPEDQAPSYIAGSIAVTPQSQGAKNLSMLGFDGSAGAHVQRVAARGAGGAAATVEDVPSENYDFSLQLLDTSFGGSGSGTFTGTGREVAIGPVSHQWMVNGTLTLNGGEAVSIQGWGTSFFWNGRGSTRDGTQIALGFVPHTFVAGSADGTVTVGTQTSFFLGTAASGQNKPAS